MPAVFPRYLSLIMLILALILPYAIVGHTYPIPTFYAEFTALGLYVGLAGALGLAAFAERHQTRLGLPRVAWVPLVFGLFMVAQIEILPTSQPSMNLLGSGYMLSAFIVVIAGYWASRLRDVEAFWHVASLALVLGGLFAVLCQLAQTFHLERLMGPVIVQYGVQTERRPFGNMAQANHLATYISFAMAAALYLVHTRQLRIWLWVLIAAALSTGEALTVSRGPWLQTAVVVLAALLLGLMERRTHKMGGSTTLRARPFWWMPLTLLAVFVVMNLLVRWGNEVLHLELGQSAAERFQDAGQISPRLALWKDGWTMFVTHPIFGVGWGQFPSFQYAFVEKLGRVEIANNAHNIIFDLLGKTGLVGFGLLVLGIGAWLWRVMRAPRSAHKVLGLTLLGVLMMHALVEYPQQYMFFLLPAALVFGLLEPATLRGVPIRPAAVIYAVVVVLGLAALAPIFQDYRRAEVLYYGNNPAVDYAAAPSKLFGAWGQYGMATLMTMNSADLRDKLAQHAQALTLLPGESVLQRYAILQALDGQNGAALDTVKRLKIFAEMLKDWPTQLGALYRYCDQQGRALSHFKGELLGLYGPVPQAVVRDSDDDDDDTDDSN